MYTASFSMTFFNVQLINSSAPAPIQYG